MKDPDHIIAGLIGEYLDEAGIRKNTIVLEIEGGVLTGVHNAPDGYVLFDWDNIKDKGETSKKCLALHSMLEALQTKQSEGEIT